jgi:hypothetical protein
MSHERAKSRTHATAPSYRRIQRAFNQHQLRIAKLESLRSRRCAPSPQP